MKSRRRARIRVTTEQAALLIGLLKEKRAELQILRDRLSTPRSATDSDSRERVGAIDAGLEELRRTLDELERTAREQGWVYADDEDPLDRW
jgi:hypothetical protein